MSFGGSQTSETVVPQYIEDWQKHQMGVVNQAAQQGPPIFTGNTVAALDPAVAGNASAMAQAAGMGGLNPNYMPQAQRDVGGTLGYAAWPGTQQNLQNIAPFGLLDPLLKMYPGMGELIGTERDAGDPFNWMFGNGTGDVFEEIVDGGEGGGGGGGSGDWSDDYNEFDYDEGIPEYDDFDAAVAGVFGGDETGSPGQGFQE